MVEAASVDTQASWPSVTGNGLCGEPAGNKLSVVVGQAGISPPQPKVQALVAWPHARLLAHLWPRNESLHLRLRWAGDTELTASGFATETVSRDTRPRCLSVHACCFDHPRPLSDKLNNKSMADRDGTDERTHTLSHAMCR